MKLQQAAEILYQALETELGGVQIYETAIECAVNEDLKKEWKEYLSQTKEHVKKVEKILEAAELDPEEETPGRKVVRHIGESLVKAMEMAREEGDAQAAELVAAECVVLAETKDHANWELIGKIAKTGEVVGAETMQKAHQEVEEEEDKHLYHNQGWARELWLRALGLEAELPPPEEKRDVTSMAEAARAKESRM